MKLNSRFVRDARLLGCQYGHQQHAFMQRIDVFEMVRQRERDADRAGGEKGGRAGQTSGRVLAQVLDEVALAFAHRRTRFFGQTLTAPPCQHQERDRGGEQQRKPSALKLDRVRRKEDQVDGEEEAVDRDDEELVEAPLDRYQRREKCVIAISSDAAMP
jgi:hypothetical protein